MAKAKGFVEYAVESCKGCGLCVAACPFDVIEMSKLVNGKGYYYPHVKNAENCTGCASCALVCPDVVITVFRVPTQKEE